MLQRIKNILRNVIPQNEDGKTTEHRDNTHGVTRFKSNGILYTVCINEFTGDPGCQNANDNLNQ